MSDKACFGGLVTVVLVLWFLLCSSVPSAYAGPACEARSAAHAAKHGISVDADSRWHVARGQLPTCKAESSAVWTPNDDNSYDDDDWGRDEFGFNCTWRGCG
jgi:hypothetical protein